MSIKITAQSNVTFPHKIDENNNNLNVEDVKPVDFRVSSATAFYSLGGQMRKMQLLKQFESNRLSNINPFATNCNYSTNSIGGDNDLIKETQRLIDNFRRQIKPKEIKGAQPAAPGMSPGHPDSKHGVKPGVQAEIMNNPERIFSGKNDKGRYVDIYYKNGSAVITEQGDKGSVITAYGKITTKGSAKPFNLQKITENPNYVEIKLEKLGSTNVIYPNRERFDAKDFPDQVPKTNNPTTNGGTAVVKPNAPVETESNVPPVEEELPTTTSGLGKLSGNISRGLVIMQLVQVGLTVLNFSKLKAEGEEKGFYIDPFYDKYIIMNPEKAAKNLPEGFELKFYPDPMDYTSQGSYITFTVKDGKFFNAEGYTLYFNQEKGYVEAAIQA